MPVRAMSLSVRARTITGRIQGVGLGKRPAEVRAWPSIWPTAGQAYGSGGGPCTERFYHLALSVR